MQVFDSSPEHASRALIDTTSMPPLTSTDTLSRHCCIFPELSPLLYSKHDQKLPPSSSKKSHHAVKHNFHPASRHICIKNFGTCYLYTSILVHRQNSNQLYQFKSNTANNFWYIAQHYCLVNTVARLGSYVYLHKRLHLADGG